MAMENKTRRCLGFLESYEMSDTPFYHHLMEIYHGLVENSDENTDSWINRGDIDEFLKLRVCVCKGGFVVSAMGLTIDNLTLLSEIYNLVVAIKNVGGDHLSIPDLPEIANFKTTYPLLYSTLLTWVFLE